MTNTADWFAKKLQQQQPQAPTARTQSVPQAPSQVPMTPFVAPQVQNPASRAVSASQTATCPDCGSSNYMSVQNTAPRCLDCGYPIQQSGSRFGALTGAHVEGGAKAAAGNNPTSNWSPMPAGYGADGRKL